ncbi:MAG: hypothetical protein IKW80_08580 [Thermoguttaceae bacterium]|nr:hypothetical protein [Thermoguttaceae bacterium]
MLEFFFLCCWLYRCFSDWISHGYINTKDRNKREVFFHAMGEASLFSIFISEIISCAGFFWWGARDETGLAWFLMFLVLLIPFVFFSVFFYKGCYALYLNDLLKQDPNSESDDR